MSGSNENKDLLFNTNEHLDLLSVLKHNKAAKELEVAAELDHFINQCSEGR